MSRRRRSTAVPVRSTRARAGSGNRLAITLAWRTSLSSVGRSALIATLIALPIAGVAGAALVAASTEPTAAERVSTELGHTQALLRLVSPPDPGLRQKATHSEVWQPGINAEAVDNTAAFADVSSLLPPGTRILPIYATAVSTSTATGVASFDALEGPTWDASLRGHYDVISGHPPDRDDEIMVTASALSRLGVSVGGSVQLRAPLIRTVTVVGILEDRTKDSAAMTIFGRTAALSGIPTAERVGVTDYYLPNLPIEWAEVRKLNQKGATVLSRSVLLDPPGAASGALEFPDYSASAPLLGFTALFGGFAIFEVVLLAGAAFAVNARQQQRTLAVVASVGATRSVLFRTISASGVVLGLAGGVLGVVLGIGGGSLVMVITGNGSATRYYGYHLQIPVMIAVVGFAAVIGWLAALAPAVSASKLDVVAALRGSRRPPLPGRLRPIVGAIVLVAGTVVALAGGALLAFEASRGDSPFNNGGTVSKIAMTLVLIGPLVAMVGIALCGPLLLRGIARLFGKAALGARLATRDAARNSGRSVPVFTAVLTTVFVAVFAMCVVSSGEARASGSYQYATTPGQAQSWLSYPKPQDSNSYTRATDPAPFASALRKTLDVKQVRTLAALPDFNFRPALLPEPGGILPVLEVPPANQCPSIPTSADYRPALDNATAADAATLRSDWRCTISYFLLSSYTGSGHLWVGDASDLALILGHTPSQRSLAALANGEAVSLYREYVDDGQVSLNWWTPRQLEAGDYYTNKSAPARTSSIPAVLETVERPINFGVFVSKATADRFGLPYVDSLVLASLKTPATPAQEDAARQATAAVTGEPSGSSFRIERGPASFAQLTSWALLGASAFIAIASSAVAIGLARFDGLRDDATLSSLGAGRRTRRNFAFWQALVLCGLGAALGAVLGILPAFALALPGTGVPFAPPWIQIALTAVGLPLGIACASWLLARRNRAYSSRTVIG